MIIVFFDARGIVHHEFVPQGQTVNQEVYISILRHMHENIEAIQVAAMMELTGIP
jgi:hypothetical protein